MLTKRYFLYILCSIIVVGLFSCTKTSSTTIEDDPNDAISDIPEITLLSFAPQDPKQYLDSIVFQINYIDGDGDIGSLDPDETVIELRDTRDPDLFFFEYHVSPRAPQGADISIQGTLDIVLNHTILLDDDNETEQTTFKIRLRDQANNWSNDLETGLITVSK